MVTTWPQVLPAVLQSEAAAAWAGVAVGATGLLLTLILYLVDRSKAALSFAVMSNRPIVSSPAHFNLEVRHGGNIVTEPRLIVLRLANGGKTTLEPEHFEKPITFRLDGPSKVLSAELTASRPEDFRPSLQIESATEVTLEPRLMNPKDMVEVQMLLDGAPARIAVDGRVARVSAIRQMRVSRTSWDEPYRMGLNQVLLSTLIYGGVAGFVAFVITEEGRRDNPVAVGGAALILVLGLLVFPWLAWRRYQLGSLFLAD